MSFVQMTKSEVVKKQYRYKLKAYKGSYSSLMIIQMIGLLFSSLVTDGINGNYIGDITFEIDVYSTNTVLAFTLLWAFITGITITNPPYRFDDFTYVTNRLTNNMSNILFLLTVSVLGATTAVLMGFVHRLLVPLLVSTEIVDSAYTFSDLTIEMTAFILYCVFFSALGYLAGIMIQYNKIFQYILPLVIIGLLFTFPEIYVPIFKTYFQETSLLLFSMKAMAAAVVSYILAIVISNRMEVRK